MNFRIFTALAFMMIAFSLDIWPTATLAQDEGKEFIEDHRIIEGVVKAKEDDYVTPDFINLSKLYWAIGKLDIDNDLMIDYYLMINECDLYMQYYHNDFEWQLIRDTTRRHILNNMNEFPTRVEMMIPLGVGRYDIDKEVFDLVEESKIAGQRRIDFVVNLMEYREYCSRHIEMYEHYPPNLIIILNRPLAMEQFPVKRELAKLYVEDQKRQYQNLDVENQMKTYERTAYLRLKVRITQYKNTVAVTGGENRAVVFGRLEGYEIYADPHKLKPLYSVDLRDKRYKRLKKYTRKKESASPAETQGEEAEDAEVSEEPEYPVEYPEEQ